MAEPTINCPKCGTDIKLTESLAAPLIHATKQKYERDAAEKELDYSRRERVLNEQQAKLGAELASMEEALATRVAAERIKISEQEAKKAKLLAATEIEAKAREVVDLHAVIAERDKKLGEAQKAQAELVRKKRELDDARREVDLTVENKVQESLGQVRAKAKQEAEDGLKLKVTEKEEQIAGMQRQIEDLKRRAEQGSQQLQGEALEIQLEAALRARFPLDFIDAVPKGEFGGDLIQRVVGPSGQVCGSILWETKRTKNFSEGWLTKLRNDQRSAKVDLAMIVTNRHAL